MSRAGARPNAPSAELDRHEVCLTCADAASWMRVLVIDATRELALCVDEEQRQHTVDIGITTGVARGERVLVHAGAALAKERG